MSALFIGAQSCCALERDAGREGRSKTAPLPGSSRWIAIILRQDYGREAPGVAGLARTDGGSAP